MLKTNANDMRDLNWPDACALAQRGATIYRASWNGKGIFCRVQYPDAGSKMSSPYFYIDTTGLSYNDHDSATRSRCPWVPSQTDMFARDWVVTDLWRMASLCGEQLHTVVDAGTTITRPHSDTRLSTTCVPTDLIRLRAQVYDLQADTDGAPVLVVSDNVESWKATLYGIDVMVTTARSEMRGRSFSRVVIDLPFLTSLMAMTVERTVASKDAHIFLVNP